MFSFCSYMSHKEKINCSYCKLPYKNLYLCQYDHKKYWEIFCYNCIRKVSYLYFDTYKFGGSIKKNKEE